MNWNREKYSPDEDDFRQILRSKVWRSKCYLQDRRLKVLGTAVLLLTVPIDRLAMNLQHLAQIQSLPDAGGSWPDGLWAQLEAARQCQAPSATYLVSSIWSATLWTA